MLWFIGILLGVILGSLAKALADRSLTNKSFMGRSYCPKCKHTLRWYDLFPIFSYLFLKGKCRYCQRPIDKTNFLAEIIVGVLLGYLFFLHQGFLPKLEDSYGLFLFSIELAFKSFFIVILTIVTITDLREYFIPDRVVIPAIKISIVSLFLIIAYKLWFFYYSLSQTPVGRYLLPPHSDYFQRHAIEDYVLFYIYSLACGMGIGLFFLMLIVLTKGKGMGGGDVKLGAFIGVALGFPMGVLAIILGFFFGAIVSVGLLILGKKHFGEIIPFGPFLVLGSLATLFFGNQIITWYLGLSL
jgi:prepilin signal peptidase PulO-like enzyme (type II secretory pathway)